MASVTWWLSINGGSGAQECAYAETVTWSAQPPVTPLAFAAEQLYLLSLGARRLPGNQPPPGPVYCTITMDVDGRPEPQQLAQAMRIFKPSDPLYQQR